MMFNLLHLLDPELATQVATFMQYVKIEDIAFRHQSLSFFWIPPIIRGLAGESSKTNLLKDGAKRNQHKC